MLGLMRWCVLALALGLGTAAWAQPPGQGQKGLEILEKAWPDHPEWASMLVDILQGSQLGPNDGWFRKAKSQTRFPWATIRKHYDKDGSGEVERKEFGGTDLDFVRLDRDRDAVLTEKDFDFSAHALAPTPGSMVFYRVDRDGNGKITRREFDQLFEFLDSGNMDFLSLSDLQQLFQQPPQRRPSSTAPAKPSSSRGPSRLTLLKGLYRQEIGSLQPGPALDEPAPDFQLKTVDGSKAVTLSKMIGPKPVVLIFGNFTCGPFRSQAGNVEKLYNRYKDRAEFVMVYVREAHPTDGWSMESNNQVGVELRQPRNYDERVQVAQACTRKLKFGFPVLVDELNDNVGARYSGMPSRLYLIDSQGKIAFKTGRGPFGFKPDELEHSLVLLLNDKPPSQSKDLGKDFGKELKN